MTSVLSSVLVVISLALAITTATGQSYQCSTGSITCCNSAQPAEAVPDLMAVLGQSAGNYEDALVGIGCRAANVVGTGYVCDDAQEPLCCTTNNQNDGAVNFGCSPASVASATEDNGTGDGILSAHSEL